MPQVRSRIVLISLALAIFLFLLAPLSLAQKIEPVFSQNSIDGFLLGLEGSLNLGILEPFLGAAYGINSGNIRYKIGSGLGPAAFSSLDWPGSAVLGREGEKGLRGDLTLKKLELEASCFFGQLWLIKEQETASPKVAYLSLSRKMTWKLPFDVEIRSSGDFTFGSVLEGKINGKTFQSTLRSFMLRVGKLRLEYSSGTAKNEARLAGFEFTAKVKGYEKPLQGDSFWTLSVERRFELFSSLLDLPMLGALPFIVDGSVFFASGSAAKKDQEKEPEILFGWGFGTVFSLAGFQMRTDAFFNKEGQFKFLVESAGKF